jgi:hypothetical protein
MIKTTTPILFAFILFMHTAYGQEIALIKADSSWGKEVFQFPLSFAPEIKFKGIEEARFPKAWAKKDSAAFWSYAFAWQIETQTALTAEDLENNLRLYFDGLMSAVSGLAKEKFPATITVFVQNKIDESRSFFKGKIQIYDAFTLKAPLLLNVSVEQYFCVKNHQSILLFRFSPKTQAHFTWKQLNTLTLLDSLLNKEKCD